MPHGSTFLPADPLSSHLTLGNGVNRSKSTFSEHGHIAYQIKEHQECSIMVAIFFAHRPLPDPAVGVKRSFFSKHGHVAYKIKENHECSNMVANILPAGPPLSLDEVNRIFFRIWSSCISN